MPIKIMSMQRYSCFGRITTSRRMMGCLQAIDIIINLLFRYRVLVFLRLLRSLLCQQNSRSNVYTQVLSQPARCFSFVLLYGFQFFCPFFILNRSLARHRSSVDGAQLWHVILGIDSSYEGFLSSSLVPASSQHRCGTFMHRFRG
jgi:hypothetical protein